MGISTAQKLERQWLLFQQKPVSPRRLSFDSLRFLSSVVAPGHAVSEEDDAERLAKTTLDLNKAVHEYIDTKPASTRAGYDSVAKVINDGQLEVALRKVASINDVYLVLLLLHHVKHNKALTFDINALSPSTGKNALDFSESSLGNSLSKRQTMLVLHLSGAKPSADLAAVSCPHQSINMI